MLKSVQHLCYQTQETAAYKNNLRTCGHIYRAGAFPDRRQCGVHAMRQLHRQAHRREKLQYDTHTYSYDNRILYRQG